MRVTTSNAPVIASALKHTATAHKRVMQHKRKREKKQVVFLIKVLLNSMMMRMVQESLLQNTMHITTKNNSFQKQML